MDAHLSHSLLHRKQYVGFAALFIAHITSQMNDDAKVALSHKTEFEIYAFI